MGFSTNLLRVSRSELSEISGVVQVLHIVGIRELWVVGSSTKIRQSFGNSRCIQTGCLGTEWYNVSIPKICQIHCREQPKPRRLKQSEPFQIFFYQKILPVAKKFKTYKKIDCRKQSPLISITFQPPHWFKTGDGEQTWMKMIHPCLVFISIPQKDTI